MQNKNSKKIASLFLVIFILSAGFLFFGNLKTIHAAGTCSYIVAGITQTESTSDLAACTALSIKNGGSAANFLNTNANPFTGSAVNDPVTPPSVPASLPKYEAKKDVFSNARLPADPGKSTEICPHFSWTDIESYFACAFLVVLQFAGWLLALAVLLFSWVIDARKMSAVLTNPAIFKSWAIVRDFLNIGFILVLLFSAFSTIFQVDKYNYKKILLWLVIMALLVNFSYPITRFIIDVSNTLMYTILDKFFRTATEQGGTGSILTNMEGFSALENIISPKGTADPGLTQLLASVIFIFILALTILSMAVLFLIRIIALAILIIFSPVAFVGSILGKGGQWWDYLFKYAFFGPIMAFMLAISIEIMTATSQASFTNVLNGSDMDTSVITAMAQFTIPIVVLWIGMGVAQKMGIEGASEVIGKAQSVAKWAGSTFSGYRAASWGVKTAAKKTGELVNYGVNAGLEKFERDVLGEKLSPRAWIAGWKQRSEEVDKDFISTASGAARDKLNMLLDNSKTNYKQLAKDQIKSKKLKEMKESSENTLYHLRQAEALIGVDDERAGNIIDSMLKIGFAQRDQNDIINYIRANYDKPLLAGGKTYHQLLGDGTNGTTDVPESDLGVSGYNINLIASKMLEASGASKQEVIKAIMDLDEIAGANGGVGYGGSIMDEQSGEFRLAHSKEEQAHVAIAKLLTLGEAQKMAQMIHQNYFNDEHGKLNLEFSELVANGTLAEITEHIARHKSDMYKKVGRNPDLITKMKKQVNDMYDDGRLGGAGPNGEPRKPNEGPGGEMLWNAKLGTAERTYIKEQERDIALKYIDKLEQFSKGEGKGEKVKTTPAKTGTTDGDESTNTVATENSKRTPNSAPQRGHKAKPTPRRGRP